MTTSARAQNISFGIAMIVATALTISLQDVVFKLFSSELTLAQIFTLRGMIAVPALILIALGRGQLREVVRSALRPWSVIRGFCLTMTFLVFYAAIPFLSLSTLGAANYTAPIFVALLAALFLSERVRPVGWIGVLLGFAGVLVLLRPGSEAFSLFALLPVISALFYATAHVLTRSRCGDEPVVGLALALNAIMTVAGLLISVLWALGFAPEGLAEQYPYLFGQWAAVSGTDWLFLLVLAAFTISIAMMTAAAYQSAPPATIATFEYSYLVFVALWDILFFALAPTAFTLAGMAMIAAAGLLVMRR